MSPQFRLWLTIVRVYKLYLLTYLITIIISVNASKKAQLSLIGSRPQASNKLNTLRYYIYWPGSSFVQFVALSGPA